MASPVAANAVPAAKAMAPLLTAADRTFNTVVQNAYNVAAARAARVAWASFPAPAAALLPTPSDVQLHGIVQAVLAVRAPALMAAFPGLSV